MKNSLAKKIAPLYSTINTEGKNKKIRNGTKISIVPGLYFKSYSRYTESRIPFEIFGTISMALSLGSYTSVADFNIKAPNEKFSNGEIIFPSLVFDSNFYNGAANCLAKLGSQIYVFMISIHTNGNMFHALKIASELKKVHKNSLIVFAGLGPSSQAPYVLASYPSVDVIIKGESEATFTDLILRIDQGKEDNNQKEILLDIPGISFLLNGIFHRTENRPLIKDLDELPFPNFEYYGTAINQLSKYTQETKYLNVEENIHLEAGRGCPFDCTFCSNGYLWERKYRLKSPKRIINEMRECKEKFGATKFLLHQQLFSANKAKTLDFCYRLIESKLDVEWSCFTRNDCVDPEILKAMKASGCNTVMYGIESGSQAIQDSLNKKMYLKDIRKQIKMTMDYGIKPQLLTWRI